MYPLRRQYFSLWRVATLSLLAFPAAFALAAPPAQKMESIPLYISANRILVMLRVGDHAPAPVVFDTGTNGNLLDRKFAKEVNIPRTGDSHSVDGSTGKSVSGFEGLLKNARLSDVKVDDGHITVLDYPATDEVGIFGPNSFPGRLVFLDFAAGVLRIEEKNPSTIPAGPSFPYSGKNGDTLPALPIEVGGIPMIAVLDSGNNSPLLLPTSYIEKLSLEAPPTVIGEAVSAAGKQPIYEARLKGDLQIASVTLKNPKIRFMKGGTPNLGLPILRHFSFAFDPSEGKTWVIASPTGVVDRPQ